MRLASLLLGAALLQIYDALPQGLVALPQALVAQTTKPMTGVSRPPDSSAALLSLVDAHYNKLASLVAHYTERYAGMGLSRIESGTLLLRKPGRMLWRYDSPAGKVFVLDGRYAWFYTPGDAQVSRAPAKQLDDLRTPLRFLLGHTELKRELDNVGVEPDGGGFRITGIPHGMENRVRRLTLQVTAAGQITGMRLEETDGVTTEFTFTAIRENVPTRPSDFVFTPPAGVTVIDAPPPV